MIRLPGETIGFLKIATRSTARIQLSTGISSVPSANIGRELKKRREDQFQRMTFGLRRSAANISLSLQEKPKVMGKTPK